MNKKNITVVSAVVKDTGWPIDGHRLAFVDPGAESNDWQLYGWEDPDDEAVKLTIWAWLVDTGNTNLRTFEAYEQAWNEKKPVTGAKFTLQGENLTDIEIEQEGVTVPADPAPKKPTGTLLLPLKRRFPDAAENHPDWHLIKCPTCGQDCWEFPEARRLQLTQGTAVMCTDCGVKAGLVTAYNEKNVPHPDGNRKTRRDKKKAARRRKL